VKLIRPMTINDAALVSSNVAETDEEVWSASKYYATGDEVMVTTGTHKRYEALTGTGETVSMTIATPCVITWPGSAPAVDTPFQLSTTGALPTNLVAGTTYYVKAPSGATSNVAATAGGANINTTGSQSGVHTSRRGVNLNKDPTDQTNNADEWLELGSTNRWKMFDQSISAPTTNADEIEVVLQQSERVNSVAVLNVSAAQVQVVMTDPTDGVVYDETVSLVSDSGIQDWYAYFFEPIVRLSDQVFTDLPPYAAATLTVTLTDTGSTVSCGELVAGLSREIGGTNYGAELGIQDYSVKTRDDFGNFTILEREYSRRGVFSLWLDAGFTDELFELLSSYRATPIVYIGSDDLRSSIIFGFFKDFNVELAYPSITLCSIEIEGLT
jgi:hypothetical protein